MLGKAALSAFKNDAIETASNEKLLTLLVDRLCLDIERAQMAHKQGKTGDASGHLIHAQNIVSALQDALDHSWSSASDFASLYSYLYELLVKANTTRNAELMAECLEIAQPLRELWNDVATKAASEKAPAPQASA